MKEEWEELVLYMGMRLGLCPGVWLEGWLRCFASTLVVLSAEGICIPYFQFFVLLVFLVCLFCFEGVFFFG